jgi:hypothetical protein
MSVTLTVNNIPFEYPVSGDEPGWAEGATGWAEEVTEVLGELLGPNDIIETTFNIQNNISTFTNIASLSFNTGEVRGAAINYTIYRVSDTTTSGKAESGTINIVYDNAAASGSKWTYTVFGVNGNSGVTFDVTDAGQFQYKSTDIGSAGYSGVMTFRAKSLSY